MGSLGLCPDRRVGRPLVGVDRRAADHRRNDRTPGSLLDIDALAARLGVTARFVRRLVEERRVPYVKIGRLVRFDPVEVERWIDTARVEPARLPSRTWSRRLR
jgi:excisionase family DNA binding protein